MSQAFSYIHTDYYYVLVTGVFRENPLEEKKGVPEQELCPQPLTRIFSLLYNWDQSSGWAYDSPQRKDFCFWCISVGFNSVKIRIIWFWILNVGTNADSNLYPDINFKTSC